MPQGAWPHHNRRFDLTYEHAGGHNLPHHCIGVSQHDNRSFSSVRDPHLRSGGYSPRRVLILLVDVHRDQAWQQGEEGRRRVSASSPGLTFPGVLTPSIAPSPIPCRSDSTYSHITTDAKCLTRRRRIYPLYLCASCIPTTISISLSWHLCSAGLAFLVSALFSSYHPTPIDTWVL